VPKELVPPIRDAARCEAGQVNDCLGGTARVIVTPLPDQAASATR
jgi:hypothetical protein